MISSRRFPPFAAFAWGARLAAVGALWGTAVFVAYALTGIEAIRIPFLPIATIGTAVAFYVGFKNNSSYERFWEGRKIWGDIICASRTWANAVLTWVMPGDDTPAATAMRRELIYRHMAWANAVRLQLRKTSRFFDAPARGTKRRLDNHAEHMRNDWDKELTPFLTSAERVAISGRHNPAAHLLRRQGEVLQGLYGDKHLDLFHQIELMGYLESHASLQAQCERIKTTPFPRQYAEFSRLFTRVFMFMVPFGLLDVFANNVAAATTTFETLTPVVPMILSGALITWVFGTMEGIGDASEDPFERSMNDVPMNALCRTLEIDLREMLGETALPEPEQPIDNLLY